MNLTTAVEQIKRFQDFIEDTYHAQLLENTRKGNKFLLIDFNELSKYDPDLATELLDYPEEVIKAMEKAIENIEDIKDFRVCIHNLPEIRNIKIRDIRSEHIGKLLSFYGVVRQLSDIIPSVSYVKYECNLCGNIMGVISTQGSKILKEPSRCACGKKGGFIRIDKEMIDMQRLVIEESSENLEGNQQPKRLGIMLRGFLTNPTMEGVTRPGNRVVVTGILYDNPKYIKNIETIEREFVLEANYVKPMEDEYLNIEITPEDEKQIIEFSKREDLMEYLVKEYCPAIYGSETIKEAIILHLFGGVTTLARGSKKFGEIPILIIGDTGLGKTYLLKFEKNFSPKYYFVSGETATGIGVTASVEKDEFLQTWALKAGPMVLAHKGHLAIDELDKMNDEDRNKMHQALADGVITISKATIQATLLAETGILSACNPKNQRFDPYHDDLSDQIDLPITLINRFDLIFPMQERIDKEIDTKIIETMLDSLEEDITKEQKEFYIFIKKYIFYSKRINPKLIAESKEKIKQFYINTRQRKTTSTKLVPITPRQGMSLLKLAQASARSRLSINVLTEDVKRAERILMYYLEKLALDPETGVIDIDRIATGMTYSTRNNLKILIDILNQLSKTMGKTIPIDDVIVEAVKQGINESEIEELIEKLKRGGDIIEPRRGYLMVI